jgi:hypothetical protein
MKLLSAAALSATIAVLAIALTLLQPLAAAQGTSVIHTPASATTKATTVLMPKTMARPQLELLDYAYQVALKDGHKYPQYVQGVMMQESRAGAMSGFRVAGLTNKVGDRYAGICQIKLVAAKAVLAAYPKMWGKLDTKTDEELFARLILDDKFNIDVCSKYLLLMGVNSDPARGIAAFNQGPGGVQAIENPADFHYTKGVINYVGVVKNMK